MKSKKLLLISIIIFILVAIIALYLVLNKGHIGKFSLVSTETNREENEVVLPTVVLKLEKEYLSSSNKDESAGMTVYIDGEVATEGVIFESSNEEIVKIDEENKLIPVSDGKATIKAIYNGVEATSEVNVITPIKSMTFTSTNSTIRVGKDLQLKLKVTPSDACIDTLTYTSSDESIATVNSNGIVTGVSAGKVTITVYDSYTKTEKSVKLTIRK